MKISSSNSQVETTQFQIFPKLKYHTVYNFCLHEAWVHIIPLHLRRRVFKLRLLKGNGSSSMLGFLDARPRGGIFLFLAQLKLDVEVFLVGGALFVNESVLMGDLENSETFIIHKANESQIHILASYLSKLNGQFFKLCYKHHSFPSNFRVIKKALNSTLKVVFFFL